RNQLLCVEIVTESVDLDALPCKHHMNIRGGAQRRAAPTGSQSRSHRKQGIVPETTDTHAHSLTAAGQTAGAAAGEALPAIELAGVSKEFRTGGDVVPAVRTMDLRIAEGEFFSLLGPSGCGKTTTMRMIAGFEEPTTGTIMLHGRDVIGVPPNKRDVNMVFQSYALFPHMNVFENVAFGLRRVGVCDIDRRVYADR